MLKLLTCVYMYYDYTNEPRFESSGQLSRSLLKNIIYIYL